jgi:uncharacterized protein (TIGR03437 family)
LGRFVLISSLLVLAVAPEVQAQVCRLSVAGLNRARRAMGAIHAECPALFTPHTPPFGNWGVTSNFGMKADSHQFDGWCHDTWVCNNLGICRTDCTDGWFEWNSCTDDPLYRPPNCTLYNAADCTEQASTKGVNVHGTKVIDLAAACPSDTDGDGIADHGGCSAVTGYSPGTNFLSIYELDPGTSDELIQTVYFPETPVSLQCGVFGCPPAGSDWVGPVAYDSPSSPPKIHAEMAAVVNWAAFLDENDRCAAATSAATTVSAASYQGPELAAASIASAFGGGFSTTSETATTLPLPFSLAGVSVIVTDSLGASRPAPLFFVSSSQINLLIPNETAGGAAAITVARGSKIRWRSAVTVAQVAPGLFSANSDGRGVAAAVALLVRSDGSRTSQLAFECADGAGSCVPLPLELGAGNDRAFLQLFGTGIRGRQALEDVHVQIGGMEAEVLYAGPQGSFVGLDQVNVEIPRALAGKGEVEVMLAVGAETSNLVTVAFH